jgi:photosystem II stability/assembly factor-like uncharacterized protein
MPTNATARRNRAILPVWLGLSLATALGALLLAAWVGPQVKMEGAGPATTATPTPSPARPATLEAPLPAATDELELTGPLLVDSQAGRLYASGRAGEDKKTFALAASDGRLLATYGITGSPALDSVHGWLYVDRGDQGLAVLHARTGALQASIPLTRSQVVAEVYRRPDPAPQADPASGQVLAFRDNLVYLADPQQGLVTRVIPFDIPKGNDCRMAGGPLPIKWATYDSARRILYLDFETYVCTPWISDTLLSYDMTSGAEVARQGVPVQFSATAFDGYLYGASWFRMGDGFRWAWRDGQPWFESSDWSYGAPGFVVDAARQRLYALDTGGLYVFDARTMTLITIDPLALDGQLAGYDPGTDQLYFLVNGGLRPWPVSAIQPPMPQPLSASQPPTTPVRSLVVSPTWHQDKTMFGTWNAGDLLTPCWVFGKYGGPLYVSGDAGGAWSRSHAGLPDGCDTLSALAVSPAYARDRTLLAGVVGLGIFRSTDGGQLWEPSSAGLPSMGVEQLLMSPGFARDGTAFARLAPAGGEGSLYRSMDGGQSWQTLDISLELVAMSPEFDQDHTLMGVVYSCAGQEQRWELYLSRDGGDDWERIGDTPDGKMLYWLSLAPLFDRWQVVFAQGSDGTLYRSADGGESWDAVLNIGYPMVVNPYFVPGQLVYAPDIEANRPLFLLVRIRHDMADPASERGILYRSGDGGLTWGEVGLVEDVSPTALAISPNFARDGLLFVGTADGRVLTVEDGALAGPLR